MAIHIFEKRRRFQSKGIIASLALFALLVLLFLYMLSQVETKNATQQNRLLEDALRRAMISCYAIEGRYPPSIDYIVENYGVFFDEDKYAISYSAFASNVMPNINVLSKGATIE